MRFLGLGIHFNERFLYGITPILAMRLSGFKHILCDTMMAPVEELQTFFQGR